VAAVPGIFSTAYFGAYIGVGYWAMGGSMYQGFSGSLCEILLFPVALSSSMRPQVSAVLRAKWGTP
jgi:hypothetical protein